ncbi:MAG: bifunctional phosphoribosyl-AMP cyclohydrolase/phosphoribosyl-ATP diphosphatase HisIE [Candidatus Micrarchaeia archaeon]
MRMSEEEAKKVADSLNFEKGNGFVVAVAQSERREVLMVAFQNKEAVIKTLTTGKMYYYSRERNRLWRKGEESGNEQTLIRYAVDCDRDAMLYTVRQKGVACHTGRRTCFSETGENEETKISLERLYEIIRDRKDNPKEGSYTNKLLEDKEMIIKKLVEESGELVEAAEKGKKEDIVWETCDLLYHLFVLLVHEGISIDELEVELGRRHAEKEKRR